MELKRLRNWGETFHIELFYTRFTTEFESDPGANLILSLLSFTAGKITRITEIFLILLAIVTTRVVKLK